MRSADRGGFSIEEFPASRLGTIDVCEVGRSRHHVVALAELARLGARPGLGVRCGGGCRARKGDRGKMDVDTGELSARDYTFSDTGRQERGRLTLRHDEAAGTWSISDKPTGLLVTDLRLTAGSEGAPLPLVAALRREPSVTTALASAPAPRQAVYAAGADSAVKLRWELAGPLGPLSLALLVEGPSAGAGGLRVGLEALVSFQEESVSCRLASSGDEAVLQASHGDPDNDLNDALYCRSRDAAIELQAPERRLRRRKDASGTGPSGHTFTAGAAVDPGRWCTLLTLTLKDRVYGALSPFFRPKARASRHAVATGWMSYYCLFEDPNEEKVLAILDFVEKHLAPFGMEYFSVEMWQSNHLWVVKDGKRQPVDRHYWSVDNVKFPRGMKWLADQIRSRGLKPGIWAIPFGIHDEVYYALHKELFLHDAEGRPFENWSGAYLLDPTCAEAKELMRRYVRLLAKEWGYDFLKLDGLSGGDHYSERFLRRPDVVRSFRNPCEAPYRDALLLMRAAMGEDKYLLACGGDLTGAVTGIADGARVSGDPIRSGEDPSWDTVLYSVRAASRMYFVHDYLWQNDPDILMVRPPLTLEEVRAWASTIALTGQVLFNSDILPEVPFDRISVLQKTMPVLEASPAQLFPVELKNVYDLKIRRDDEQWDVVGFFNWQKEKGGPPVTLHLRFQDLGCDPERTYLAYDYWDDRFVGAFTGGLDVSVESRSCKVYCIREHRGVPQLLSVDRHITQDAVSLEGLRWDAGTSRLSGRSRIVGGHPYTLSIFVPEAWRVRNAEAAGEVRSSLQPVGGNVVKLRLEAVESRVVAWRLHCDRR